MSRKKERRPNLPQDTLARARAELYNEAPKPAVTAAPARVATPKPAPVKPAVSVQDLHDEYVYLISDLRSMLILAVILAVGMVVVSLILV